MKKTLKTLVLAIVLTVCGNVAQAQLKIGYIYADSLVIMMPEAKKADSVVQAESVKWENILAKKDEEVKSLYDSIMKTINAHGGKEPSDDPVYQVLVSDYQEKSKKLSEFQQSAQNNISIKRQAAYEPIINKVKQTITDVAKEKGYTYVLDASAGGILYSPPSDNLMGDVKKKLGLK